MWNLNGDDIKRAKDELKGRRAAIQARYDNEIQQLEVDIADIETFERFAVKFVSDFKGEDGAAAAEPAPAETIVADIVSEPAGAMLEESVVAAAAGPDLAAVPEPAAPEPAVPEPAPGQKNSSRWRMRLNTGEVSP